MRQMGDFLVSASAFGDVLMGRHPSAIRQWFVHDLDRASVGGLDDHGIFQPDVPQDEVAKFPLVSNERSGGLSMSDDVAESAARFHHLRRQTVHLDIALVADAKA